MNHDPFDWQVIHQAMIPHRQWFHCGDEATQPEHEHFIDPRPDGYQYRRHVLTRQWQWFHWREEMGSGMWLDCDEPPDGLLITEREAARQWTERQDRWRAVFDAWCRHPWEPRPPEIAG